LNICYLKIIKYFQISSSSLGGGAKTPNTYGRLELRHFAHIIFKMVMKQELCLSFSNEAAGWDRKLSSYTWAVPPRGSTLQTVLVPMPVFILQQCDILCNTVSKTKLCPNTKHKVWAWVCCEYGNVIYLTTLTFILVELMLLCIKVNKRRKTKIYFIKSLCG
jgi:hypothetical protein